MLRVRKVEMVPVIRVMQLVAVGVLQLKIFPLRENLVLKKVLMLLLLLGKFSYFQASTIFPHVCRTMDLLNCLRTFRASRSWHRFYMSVFRAF